jgi:hypothetical protein
VRERDLRRRHVHARLHRLAIDCIPIHELGHTLGFRHEHTRAPDGCFEDSSWRELTAYDPGSTMHYPWCPGGQVTSTLQPTPFDAEGAAAVHGPPSI